MGQIVLRDGRGELEISVSLDFDVGNGNQTLPMGYAYSVGPDSKGKHAALLELFGAERPQLLSAGHSGTCARDVLYGQARVWARDYAKEQGHEFLDDTQFVD